VQAARRALWPEPLLCLISIGSASKFLWNVLFIASVRSQVFGDESEFVRDLGCYVAVFSTANPYRLSDTELWYSIPGKRDMSGKSVLLYPVRHNQCEPCSRRVFCSGYCRLFACQTCSECADIFLSATFLNCQVDDPPLARTHAANGRYFVPHEKLCAPA
jgi:hypothetical protein